MIESQVVGSNALKLLRMIAMPPQQQLQGGGGKWDPMQVQYVKLGKNILRYPGDSDSHPFRRFCTF